MRKIVNLLSMVFLIAHMGYSQESSQTNTVIISSMSTPEQLSSLAEDIKQLGIYLEIDDVQWNRSSTQIRSMDFSVQFRKKNGKLGNKVSQSFKYNVLTESAIVLLQNGGQIMANNEMIFTELKDMIVPDLKTKNTLYSNFSKPINANDHSVLDKLASNLQSYFHSSNELVNQINKERDPGLKEYKYRYYYNGERLDGSFGISEVDMTSDAAIKMDKDGKLSLFINSEIPLSPIAVVID